MTRPSMPTPGSVCRTKTPTSPLTTSTSRRLSFQKVSRTRRQLKTMQLRLKLTQRVRRTKSYISLAESSGRTPRLSQSQRDLEMRLHVQNMKMRYSQNGSTKSGTRPSLPHNTQILNKHLLIFTLGPATRSLNSKRNLQVPRLKLLPRKKPSAKLKKLPRPLRTRKEQRARKERRVRK